MIKKKAAETKGASLLVAILFFLVCAAAGSVILAGASSSSGRMKDLGENERTRDALTSAVRLVTARMSDRKNGRSAIIDLHAGTQEKGTVTVSSPPYTLKAEENGDLVSTAVFEGTGDPSSDEVWKNEIWPRSPFSSTFWKTGSLSSGASGKDLKSISAGLAEDVITSVWPDEDQNGNLLKGPFTDENDIRYGWTRDTVPSGGTWRYGHEKDTAGGGVDSYAASGSAAAKRLNRVLKVRSYRFSPEGKDDEKDQAIVDVYMDQFFDLEIHVYPADESLYEAGSSGPSGTGTKVSFENAPMRYLVRIPAHRGTVRYSQKVKAEPGSGSGKRKIRVTRSITLKGFYLGKARIYTGDSIDGHVYAYNGYIQPELRTE